LFSHLVYTLKILITLLRCFIFYSPFIPPFTSERIQSQRPRETLALAVLHPSTVPLVQPWLTNNIPTIIYYCNPCLILFQQSYLVSCYRKEKEQKKPELLGFLCGRITRKQPWMVRHLCHTDYILFTGLLNCFALGHIPKIKMKRFKMFGR